MPSDPPYAGWARIITINVRTIKPADPRPFQSNPVMRREAGGRGQASVAHYSGTKLKVHLRTIKLKSFVEAILLL